MFMANQWSLAREKANICQLTLLSSVLNENYNCCDASGNQNIITLCVVTFCKMATFREQMRDSVSTTKEHFSQ